MVFEGEAFGSEIGALIRGLRELPSPSHHVRTQ